MGMSFILMMLGHKQSTKDFNLTLTLKEDSEDHSSFFMIDVYKEFHGKPSNDCWLCTMDSINMDIVSYYLI